MRKLFVGFIVVGLVMFALASAAWGQDEIPTATVTITTDGLSAPETLPEGLITVNFQNESEAPFIGVLLRLNDGVTLEDFFASMAEDPLGMLPLVSLRGGPGIMPGAVSSITYTLDAGEYVLANFAGEPQIATITVEDATDTTFDEPRADVNVTMVDFGFGLPLTVGAGERTWRIENAGQQWHELAIAAIEPGSTIDDVLAMLAEGEESALQQLPILMPMDAGEVVYLTTTLQAGTYAIICNLPDLLNMDEMHIHAELGMIQLITVTDTLTYTDAAGVFTLEYPTALPAVQPDLAQQFGMPFPSVGFADSETTLETSSAAQPIPDGGWGIGVMVIPAAFFTSMGMPEGAEITDLVMAFAPAPDNAAGSELSAMETITLADGTPAVQVETDGITEDNLNVFFEVSDDVYVLVAMVSAVDGRTDAMVEQLMALVNSIEFTSTVEALMAGMSGT